MTVPDDDHALLALLREVPVHRASAGLQRAYFELTREVVAAVSTARSR